MKTGHEATTNIPPAEQEIRLDKESLLSGVRSRGLFDGAYADIEEVLRNVFGDLTRNPERRKKYERFIKTFFKADRLWRLAGLPHATERFRAFLLIYAQQRFFDDVIDGDTPKRIAPAERIAYARKRLHNLGTDSLDPSDVVDAFGLKITSDIERIDSGYLAHGREHLHQIMASIAYDGERIRHKEETGSWKFLPAEELDDHFFSLDIEGVIGLTLFLFGFEDSQKNRELLTPLGQAARVSYNVRDFADDTRAGICNIPEEEAQALGITDDDLRAVVAANGNVKKYPANIKTWLRTEAARGRGLLRKHKEQPLSRLEMSCHQKRHGMRMPAVLYRALVEHGVLNLMYVFGARKTFWKTLRAVGSEPKLK